MMHTGPSNVQFDSKLCKKWLSILASLAKRSWKEIGIVKFVIVEVNIFKKMWFWGKKVEKLVEVIYQNRQKLFRVMILEE